RTPGPPPFSSMNPIVRESSRSCCDRRDFTDIFLAFCMPRVIRGLHSSPNPSTVAKELAEPNCNGWRNRLALIQNVVKVLARNSDETGNFHLAPPGGRDHFVAKQCARMRRAPVRIALCRIDHFQSPS